MGEVILHAPIGELVRRAYSRSDHLFVTKRLNYPNDPAIRNHAAGVTGRMSGKFDAPDLSNINRRRDDVTKIAIVLFKIERNFKV